MGKQKFSTRFTVANMPVSPASSRPAGQSHPEPDYRCYPPIIVRRSLTFKASVCYN
jgi:hypothetical protein